MSLHARIDPPAPEGARLLHEEYHVGDYFRSFILSDEVDRERITAEFRERGSSAHAAQGRSGSFQANRDPIVNRLHGVTWPGEIAFVQLAW